MIDEQLKIMQLSDLNFTANTTAVTQLAAVIQHYFNFMAIMSAKGSLMHEK